MLEKPMKCELDRYCNLQDVLAPFMAAADTVGKR